MGRETGHENINQIRDTVNNGETNKHTFSGDSGLIKIPARYIKITHKGNNSQTLKVKINLDGDTIEASYFELDHTNQSENFVEIEADVYNVALTPLGAYNVDYEILYRW